MTPYEVSFFLFFEGGFMSNLLRYISYGDYLKIKECDDIYLKSSVLVRILFKDKKDKSGNPYLGHLFRVSSKMVW